MNIPLVHPENKTHDEQVHFFEQQLKLARARQCHFRMTAATSFQNTLSYFWRWVLYSEFRLQMKTNLSALILRGWLFFNYNKCVFDGITSLKNANL